MTKRTADPIFFPTPEKFRAWLVKNHDKAKEIFLGFYRKGSGKRGITYVEALDEALCFGWIDGVRRKIDEDSYTNRFSPRRTGSYWSEINIAKAKALKAAGRMMPPGLAAFARRDESRAARYSFEAKTAEFNAAAMKKFRANRKAWAYFSGKPPGYRRLMTFWVMSAKQQATRDRRLAALIEHSAEGRPIPLLTPIPKKEG
jgi:uncharacterized protein YdeI (YjbR/CyaY-like superfamily)